MTTPATSADVHPSPGDRADPGAWPPVDEPALRVIVREDAVGALVRRDGLMADLGTDGGVVRLDWVDEVGRLLDDPAALTSVEAMADRLWQRGVRRVIWAGMGGSVNAVRVLLELGFGRGDSGIAVHPLDSTDPAALDGLVSALAAAKGVALPDGPPTAAAIRDLFIDTHLVAVSMGVTSDEPITHLVWYLDLLAAAGLPPEEYATVLTVDGSHLGEYAVRRGLAISPVYVTGRAGFAGRMSAPGTLVFLLPVTLHFAGSGGGQTRAALAEAWRMHDLAGAQTEPARHPYVRLASALAGASVDGCCRLMVSGPPPGSALLTWIEQLLEQTLGKGGQGVVVFDDQAGPPTPGTLLLPLPSLPSGPDPVHRLAAVAATFLGWQLCAALYAYLHRIRIVDEPAVERYKAHARRLREAPDPLVETAAWPQRVITTGDAGYHEAITTLAGVLRAAASAPEPRRRLGYLDITINGEAPPSHGDELRQRSREVGNDLLGVPVKVRWAPAAYHVSEQSEMDGPPQVVSIRAVARHRESARLGSYSDRFLVAQAVASWLAMNEVGRDCVLVVVDDLTGLSRVLADLGQAIKAGSPEGR